MREPTDVSYNIMEYKTPLLIPVFAKGSISVNLEHFTLGRLPPHLLLQSSYFFSATLL
jgi:hypothetical protein